MRSPRDELLFNAASLWPAGPLNGRVANYTGPGIALDWVEIEPHDAAILSVSSTVVSNHPIGFRYYSVGRID